MSDWKRQIVLAAELPAFGESGDVSAWWKLDAALVALARAAMARRVGLLVPYEEGIAPLVAHVAGEYVVPRFAESLEQEPPSAIRAVSFFASPSGGKKKRAFQANWLEPFLRLGVTDESVTALPILVDRLRPSAVVAIGGGRKVEATITIGRNAGLPIYRLLGVHAGGRKRADRGASSWEEHLEAELAELRSKLELYDAKMDGQELRSDEESSPLREPPFFRLTPPLALYAQLLIAEVLDDRAQ
jgi:hypothetical protein